MSGRSPARTIVITGAASRVGVAVRARFEADRARVIAVDERTSAQRSADVVADLSTPAGRSAAINAVLQRAAGPIDGLVVCSDLAFTESVRRLVSSTYFGSVGVLDGLRPVLAAGTHPAAVVVLSNAGGITPVPDPALLETMLDAGEASALALVDGLDPIEVHGMCHAALARAVRRRVAEWGRARVRLNGVAVGPLPSGDEPTRAPRRTELGGDGITDAAFGPVLEALPIPLDRRAEPDEIASVVDFLLRPAASAVHGAIVVADAGTDALVRPDSA